MLQPISGRTVIELPATTLYSNFRSISQREYLEIDRTISSLRRIGLVRRKLSLAGKQPTLRRLRQVKTRTNLYTYPTLLRTFAVRMESGFGAFLQIRCSMTRLIAGRLSHFVLLYDAVQMIFPNWYINIPYRAFCILLIEKKQKKNNNNIHTSKRHSGGTYQTFVEKMHINIFSHCSFHLRVSHTMEGVAHDAPLATLDIMP